MRGIASLLLLLLCMHHIAQVCEALEGDELHAAIKRLPEKKRNKSHKKFRFFDRNKDGKIIREEFREGLTKLGYKVRENKLDHVMTDLDRDNDGFVEQHEFLRPVAVKHMEEEEEAAVANAGEADHLWDIFDMDADGGVTPEEFFEAIRHRPNHDITQSEVQDFFKEFADVNGDGILSYEELDTLDKSY